MKNRLYAERSEIPISFAISGVVFNSATVAELGYLKGGDRKSDKFQKLTVALRSTKEIGLTESSAQRTQPQEIITDVVFKLQRL